MFPYKYTIPCLYSYSVSYLPVAPLVQVRPVMYRDVHAGYDRPVVLHEEVYVMEEDTVELEQFPGLQEAEIHGGRLVIYGRPRLPSSAEMRIRKSWKTK